MGTLDFYDTDSGPIGIMQMDIDDSIDDVVFFIPKNKNVTGEASRLKTQRLMETANTETGSRTLNDPMFDKLTESEQANLLKTQNLMRGEMKPASFNRLGGIISSRQFPGRIFNKVSGSNAFSASIKNVDRRWTDDMPSSTVSDMVDQLENSGVEFSSSPQNFRKPIRMEGALDGEKIVFSSTPISGDEYIVSLRRMGVEGTKVTPVDNRISDIRRQLGDLQSELNQEGHLMSVGNLTRRQNRIAALEAEIKTLKRK